MTDKDLLILRKAEKILTQFFKTNDFLKVSEPAHVKNYLRLYFRERMDREHFDILFFDTQNQLITHENLFMGTIDACAVYPRIIVSQVVKHNAASVILAHNHPSGVSEPSRADISITERIKKALEVIDCKVLDHFIVGGQSITSFAEKGML